MVRQINPRCVKHLIRRSQTVDRFRGTCSLPIFAHETQYESKSQASTSVPPEYSIHRPVLWVDQVESAPMLGRCRSTSNEVMSSLTLGKVPLRNAKIIVENSPSSPLVGLSNSYALFKWTRLNRNFRPAYFASVTCKLIFAFF